MKVKYSPIIQHDNGNIFPLPITKSKVEQWLDVLNYWYDEVKEIGEQYDVMWPMYEKYDKMIEEMYNLFKEM